MLVPDHMFVSILDDIKSIKARKGKLGLFKRDTDRLRSKNAALSENETSEHLVDVDVDDRPDRFASFDFKCYYEGDPDDLTYSLSGGNGGYFSIRRPPSRERVVEAISLEHPFWDIWEEDDPLFEDSDPLDGFVGLICGRSQVDFVTNKLIPKCDYVYDIWYTIFHDDVTPLCWNAEDWRVFKNKMCRVISYRPHRDGRLQFGPAGEICWVEQVRFDEILRRLKDPKLLHREINDGMCTKDLVSKLEASFAKAEARRLAAPAEALVRAQAQITELLVGQFNYLLAYLPCAPFDPGLSHRLSALDIFLDDSFDNVVSKARLSKYTKETIYCLDLACTKAELRAAKSIASVAATIAVSIPVKQSVDLRSSLGFKFSEGLRPSKISTSGSAADLWTSSSLNPA